MRTVEALEKQPLSYYLDTSAGASIVLVSALCYAVSLAVRAIRK